MSEPTTRIYRCDQCHWESDVTAETHGPRQCPRTNCVGTQSPQSEQTTLPEALRQLYQETDRPRTDVIARARAIAAECRSWGVDEQRVDYDGELGRSWLIVHLLDALEEAYAAGREARAVGERETFITGWKSGYYDGGEHDCRMFAPTAERAWADHQRRLEPAPTGEGR